MSGKIKNMLPQRGKILQGFYTPKNPEKYIGDLDRVIYRSSWEFKFLKFCDNCDKVLKYGIELIEIPYYNEITKKHAKYNVDFYVETLNDNGSITKWIIEVKPKKFIKMGKPPKRQTETTLRTYRHNLKTVLINKMKFRAAIGFAKQHDMKFGLITEGFSFNNMI